MLIVLNYVMNMLDTFIIYIFISRFFSTKLHIRKTQLLILAITSAITTVADNSFFAYFLASIVVLSFFKSNWPQKIFWCFIVMIISLVAKCLGIIVCYQRKMDHDLFPSNIFDFAHPEAFVSILFQVVFFLFVLYILKISTSRNDPVPRYLYLFLLGFVGITTLLIYGYLNILIIYRIHPNTIVHALAIFSLLLLNFLILILYDKLSVTYSSLSDQKLANVEIREKLRQYEQLEISQREIRKIRHDLQNNLLAIQSLISNNEKKNALLYIDTILKETHQTEQHSYIPNDVLNYLITQKVAFAKKRNIQVSINCFAPETFQINVKLIATVFGNLMDNAIEACEQVTSGDKLIFISIKYFDNQLFIEIKNTFNQQLLKQNFETSKENLLYHGIGLKSVKQLVNANSGLIDITTENQLFCATVILPDTQQ